MILFSCLFICFVIYSAWCSLIFIDLWFGKFGAIIISNASFAQFSLPCPSGIPAMHMLHFWQCPIILGCSVLFMLFFSFAFQFGEFLLTYLQVHWFFSWLLALDELIQDILDSVIVFLILAFPFWFFLRVSIHLFALPICSCRLSHFLLQTLNTLPTFISILSLIPKMCILSESCSGWLLCFFRMFSLAFCQTI